MSAAASKPARVLTATAPWLARALDVVLGAILTVIVAIALAQVTARYVLGSSLVWSEELNRLLYIWLIMLAAGKAAHMRVTLLVARLRGGARVAADAVAVVVPVALLLLMLNGAWKLAELTASDRLHGLGASMSWLFYGFIVGGCIWLVTVVGSAVLALDRRGNETAG